jgi:hypothetical protein
MESNKLLKAFALLLGILGLGTLGYSYLNLARVGGFSEIVS